MNILQKYFACCLFCAFLLNTNKFNREHEYIYSPAVRIHVLVGHHHISRQTQQYLDLHVHVCKVLVFNIMHCVLVRVVVKRYMKFWLEVAHHSAPYSTRRKIK